MPNKISFAHLIVFSHIFSSQARSRKEPESEVRCRYRVYLRKQVRKVGGGNFQWGLNVFQKGGFPRKVLSTISFKPITTTGRYYSERKFRVLHCVKKLNRGCQFGHDHRALLTSTPPPCVFAVVTNLYVISLFRHVFLNL